MQYYKNINLLFQNTQFSFTENNRSFIRFLAWLNKINTIVSWIWKEIHENAYNLLLFYFQEFDALLNFVKEIIGFILKKRLENDIRNSGVWLTLRKKTMLCWHQQGCIKKYFFINKEQAFIWVRRFVFTAPSRELNLRLRIED